MEVSSDAPVRPRARVLTYITACMGVMVSAWRFGAATKLLNWARSVIHHDPLVEWATARSRAPAAPVTVHGAADAAGQLMQTAHGAEKEHVNGVRMVRKIGERLDGWYNSGIEGLGKPVSTQWRCSRVAAAHAAHAAVALGSITSTTALVATRRTNAPLSIAGQVHRLLKEATTDCNLSIMYIGWMPFL
jgi:phosphatidylinositol kinase/protein kinase (PI-3  family)